MINIKIINMKTYLKALRLIYNYRKNINLYRIFIKMI